ncbi:MAG: HAMP domain-containing histidine kinase [Cyanobacteria bacterium]|nr:HAMP domain-containing histidine kinase [Cyanobacteriota bacterium]
MSCEVSTDTHFSESHPILNVLTSGVVIIDPIADNILYANPRFASLCKRAETTLSGLCFSDLVQLNPKQAEDLKSGKYDAFGELTMGQLKAAEGPELKVKIKMSLLNSKAVLVLADPFAEEQALSQVHSDFVSVVSHEFRTPLTSIKGFADTLMRYGSQLPAEQQKRFITIIKDQADRLTRLVENLLAVSKLGSGKMELSYRPISLSALYEKIIQNLQAKANQDKNYSGRTFKIEIPSKLPEAWADPDKIEQVLLNLTDNAVKYSFANSEVSIQASLVPDNADQIQVKITNHGVGIPQEHQSKIFTQFSRIDNPLTREVEGTGLGLYITKSLTLAMGGDIRLESVPNETTTFTVTFPVATAERQAAARHAEDEEDA